MIKRNISINRLSDLIYCSGLLKPYIFNDIYQRVRDWIYSGGTLKDDYIKRQYKYAENVINYRKNKKRKNVLI
ncbi:hypothetical protein BJV85_002793 [Clostridium acetobutylicum]|uniref:DUF6877 domain-containing protein n=1 Tax=Clostridium acetobutylicum (strain ATCC 824 / DSM 792 / JCM 1419 / IAM 19013 / LMG 5710 / NBRC 13948 / NRRL B-527 / VKM B-1787 / 2291 / W) TaxID=272562 RepID=Q97JR8_CLOAB|nr:MULTISPECIES: DUF6877 family protein [Clostridium]AAK79177.1 Hypothetical protein CA_C1205 [Clostridium acetobutylicum ATCC 824]ADZ20255.1 Conserved hypothetical protein [Clostridium acetobutylicum EA 2018]AEI31709.1 hypothetical protein SMB_G1225 [Clostridium acetobutylicum DSM 1731]AWV81572.1 hypothetical protein DK921_16025 [Clostridium acetobutylicum]MBC2393212.1 hypothetical protein [Clostridium acetobutylicum]